VLHLEPGSRRALCRARNRSATAAREALIRRRASARLARWARAAQGLLDVCGRPAIEFAASAEARRGAEHRRRDQRALHAEFLTGRAALGRRRCLWNDGVRHAEAPRRDRRVRFWLDAERPRRALVLGADNVFDFSSRRSRCARRGRRWR
jgi:hypothetical protein